MLFEEAYRPDELGILTKAFEGDCQALHIEQGSLEADAAAKLVMSFYNSGVTTAQGLREALTSWRAGSDLMSNNRLAS